MHVHVDTSHGQLAPCRGLTAVLASRLRPEALARTDAAASSISSVATTERISIRVWVDFVPLSNEAKHTCAGLQAYV
jgi:hypothetical protein